MGALSVAGSAFAYDYDWALSDLSGNKLDWTNNSLKVADDLTYVGDANSSWNNTVQGVVSSVKGSSTSNCFQFNVEANDIITVYAITVNGSTGKAYVNLGGLETNADIDNSGSVVLTVDAGANSGKVSVYADPNVVIKKITVVSQAYRNVVAKLTEARNEVEKAKQSVASYVTNYPNFYSAITRQLSLKASDVIIEKENDLIADAKVNGVSGVSGSSATLISDLDDIIKTVIPGIKTAAQAAKDAYEITFQKGADRAAAKTAKDLAYKSTPSNTQAADYCMYMVTEWKDKEKTQPKAWAIKADGLKEYMDQVALAHYNKVLADAKAELANFPWTDENGVDGSYPVATYNTEISKTITLIHNIIDRFLYEKDHLTEYTGLQTNVTNVSNDIAATKLTKPSGWDDLVTNVNDLVTLINKADNKHSYTKAEINGTVFADKLTDYNKGLNDAKDALTAEAKKIQNAECATVQNNLTQYSAKVTEQFTGQPDAQKQYEQAFAKLQVRLNAITGLAGDKAGYAKRVHEYATRMTEIAQINTEVNTLWQNAQSDKNTEVIQQNNDNKTKLDGEITKALNVYNEGVNKINGYKGIKGIAESAKAAIDAELVNVFDYARNIEKTKKEADQALLDANTASPATSFDYNKYSTEIGKQVTNIEKAIADARSAANDAAYSYLHDTPVYPAKLAEGTLPYAAQQITDARELFSGPLSSWSSNQYKKYGDLSGSGLMAVALLKIDSLETAKSDTETGKFIEGTGIYSTTKDFVDQHNLNRYTEDGGTTWKQRDIADYISTVAEKLQPLDGKLQDVLGRVQAYDELADSITKLKIYWSVSKANVKTGFEGVNLNDTLIAINNEIVALEDKLEKAAFGAKEKKEEINASIEAIKAELWKVDNYDIYLANEAALEEINKAIDDVKIGEINAAKEEVQKLVTEEVVNVYIVKIEAIDFSQIETSRDNLYAAHKLNETSAKEGLKASLAAISAQIKQLVEDAKAADKAAQEVPGDVNGDKSVDAADYEAIEYFAVAGDDAELTDEEKALRAKADLNGDGTVDIFDLGEFVKLYHKKNAE